MNLQMLNGYSLENFNKDSLLTLIEDGLAVHNPSHIITFHLEFFLGSHAAKVLKIKILSFLKYMQAGKQNKYSGIE